MLNSNLLKAYRVIALNKYDSKSFADNVFQAYTLIEKDHSSGQSNSHTLSNSGIKGSDFIKLCQMLCIYYPSEILAGILKLIDKKDEENVDFDEFLNGVRTVMLYDNYFEEMEGLFKYLDTKKQGKIKKDDLLESIAKLRITQETDDDKNNKCELKVPSEEEIDHVLSSTNLEEEGYLNYDEYLVCLFKVTQEGLD